MRRKFGSGAQLSSNSSSTAIDSIFKSLEAVYTTTRLVDYHGADGSV